MVDIHEHRPSDKHVWRVCKVCGKGSWIQFRYRDMSICISCSLKGLMSGENNPNWKPKVEMVCVQCGKCFEVIPAREKTARFCSRKCQGAYKSIHQSGENGSTWNGGKTKMVCPMCGKIFEVTPSIVNKRRFCSGECWGNYKAAQMQGADNFMFGRNHTAETRQKMSENGPNKFGERNPNWRGGSSFEPYCVKFNEKFKEFIRDKFDRICFLCGKSEEDNVRRLCVHHVNYDKSCLCIDVECEFVPLCASCHSKTNGNRTYWEQLITDRIQEG